MHGDLSGVKSNSVIIPIQKRYYGIPVRYHAREGSSARSWALNSLESVENSGSFKISELSEYLGEFSTDFKNVENPNSPRWPSERRTSK